MSAFCPVVVVGHVDHGKSALVRALSGIETDRLPEERLRGLTIVPGYAYCSYPEGIVDLIDAPGHSDFIRAMVSGAAGARAALLVVSLKNGIEAQTREHLQILQCLDVDRFVVALTKSDLIELDELAKRRETVVTGLARLNVHALNTVVCSAATGDGIQAIHTALRNLLSTGSDCPQSQAGILPIDRAFVAKGRGTVVTGTLLQGSLDVEDRLRLLPTGREITPRSIQSRGENRTLVQPGERVALNLRGTALEDIEIGTLIASPGAAWSTDKIDVSIKLLPDAPEGLKHMQKLRVHFGTAAASASLALYGARDITPGAIGFGQLRFDKAVGAYVKQRALLRSLTPPKTLGAVQFLNPIPNALPRVRKKRLATLMAADDGDALSIARSLCDEGNGLGDANAFLFLAGYPISEMNTKHSGAIRVFDNDCFAVEETFQTCCEVILEALDTYFQQNPLKTGMPRAALERTVFRSKLVGHAIQALERDARIENSVNGICRSGHDPVGNLTSQQVSRMSALEALVEKGGVKPPANGEIVETELDQDLLALSIRSGRLLELENVALRQVILFHHCAVASALRRLRATYPNSTKFTTSDARIELGTSRKFIVPLLEYLDHQNVTYRKGNLRWFPE